MKCSVCDKRVRKSEACFGDEGTSFEGEPLCADCYFEDEPVAEVFYGRDDVPCVISETINETNGDFSVKWRSTDPWRGYYEVKSKKYGLVNTAELLAWHESEEMLKDFDKRVRELFDEHDVEYARVFARSSNVFYQNYDLYVKKDQELLGRLLIAKARDEVDYNNPKWYRNILFGESCLKKLAELFPERKVETDYDAVKLIEELGDEALTELQTRLKVKEMKK